jgi:ATP-binding cassette, subfamily C, bacterial CydC
MRKMPPGAPQKPPDYLVESPFSIIWRLLAFMKPFSGEVLLSVLLGTAAVASGIGLIGTSAYLIARAALHPSIAVLEVAIVGVRFFGIVRAGFRYMERLVSHSVNFRLLAQIRVWFYRALDPLAPARLADYHSGDVLNRAIGDIETLENFYVRGVAPSLIALLVTAGMVLFVGQYDLKFSGVLVIGYLMSGLGIPLLIYSLSRIPGRAYIRSRAELSSIIVDGIQGMNELIVFNQSGKQLDKVRAASQELEDTQIKLAWTGGLSGALGVLLNGLTVLGVIYLAIPLINSGYNSHATSFTGSMNGWNLAVLVLMTMASFEGVIPLSSAAQNLESALQAARRLFDLVGGKPFKVKERVLDTNSTPLSAVSVPAGTLSIHNLTFSYQPNSPPALLDFSLELAPGQRIAIVGENGSGKTTLVNLLLRFWDYQVGSVEWDGNDLHQYEVEEIRSKLSVISQKTYLFSSTVRANLLLARTKALEDDLLRALEKAGLSEWLSSLPDGLDTWIGEHGLRMSGGERQRLAIARSLLQDAPLIILDEPTVHLDPILENDVLKTLFEVVLPVTGQGKSMLWITHRLKGMEKMDEIIVLKNGSIIERGTHAQLLENHGYYARLWEMQKVID